MDASNEIFESAVEFHKKNDFPISEQASKEVMSLPMNSFLTNDEINYICSHLKS